MDALNWLSVQEATSGISFFLLVEHTREANRERSEREDFTNPRHRIQSAGPTRLGYETLFRWEIVYLPPATTVFGCWSRYAVFQTEVCCPCPTYLSKMVPWDVELIPLKKRVKINLSNCPLELFGQQQNFHETSPLPKHPRSGEKNLWNASMF